MKLKFKSVFVGQDFTCEGEEYTKVGALVATKKGSATRSVFYPMDMVSVAGRKPPRKGGE